MGMTRYQHHIRSHSSHWSAADRAVAAECVWWRDWTIISYQPRFHSTKHISSLPSLLRSSLIFSSPFIFISALLFLSHLFFPFPLLVFFCSTCQMWFSSKLLAIFLWLCCILCSFFSPFASFLSFPVQHYCCLLFSPLFSIWCPCIFLLNYLQLKYFSLLCSYSLSSAESLRLACLLFLKAAQMFECVPQLQAIL